MRRVLTLNHGHAMVITDLHGSWDVYAQLRNLFLEEYEKGHLQYLIICGDLIHSYDLFERDSSLDMIMDVMSLQRELGEDTIIILSGNHEMAHIYRIPLIKRGHEFTLSFNAALAHLDSKSKHGDVNGQATYASQDILQFFMKLPFYVMTQAGVLISHAGPAVSMLDLTNTQFILEFDHRELLKQHHEYLNTQVGIQNSQVSDNSYHVLLKNQAFQILQNVLYTQNEREIKDQNGQTMTIYEVVTKQFLGQFSNIFPDTPQRVVVSGHIPVQGGHEVINPYHLRLASYTHANPRDAGEYLILDCGQPIHFADELEPMLRSTCPLYD